MDPISARMVMAAAGAGAAAEAVYVEDVFNTFLYEGTGANRTITNGFDLSGEGGMVWIKRRDGSTSNYMFDTDRGPNVFLEGDTNQLESSSSTQLTAFNSDGFDLGTSGQVNRDTSPFLSFTFKKQPGFFDLVTYTGDGVSGRTISHNLGSVPGMIWVKCLDNSSSTARDWQVYHRSIGATEYGRLHSDSAFTTSSVWDNTEPTATEFTLNASNTVNQLNATYVAYLFAHDDANDSIIKCGSYTGNGSTDGPEIDLGWEPQWVLIKRTDTSDDWVILDTARGIVYDGNDAAFTVNGPAVAEDSTASLLNLTANGFKPTSSNSIVNGSGGNYIYMAIRRPDKAPATGTDFFQVRARTASGTSENSSIDFNADCGIIKRRGGATNWIVSTRGFPDFDYIGTNLANAILSSTDRASVRSDEDSTVAFGSNTDVNASGQTYVDYFWKRTRGAFDIVFYTGTGVAGRTVTHGLGAIPKAIWVKRLSSTLNWGAYFEPIGNTKGLRLNLTNSSATSSAYWNDTSPTATEFTVGNGTAVNTNNEDYVAYLFGNVPGVIDIGSYTGTGVAGLQIDCGFSAGARFVLIKREDSTGEWFVWDSARGIVAGTEPYSFLNQSNAEITSNDFIDPNSSGFEIADSGATLNASGGTYVYMAIA